MEKNFKILTITIGVVLVWRGIWELAEIFLFPNDPILSSLISIVIGLFILFVINIKDKDFGELL